MWEVTWGWDFENRNGNAPKFTMESNGGLTGINGGPVPAYMLNYKTGVEWQWLYVTTDRVVTYQFADGTVRTATITGTSCTPSIVWTETPPVVIPNSIETSHTVGCVEGVPTVTITLRNVSPWIYPTSVEIDGVHSYGPTVDNRTNGKLDGPQKDQSKTRTITFAEDSGDHTVRYRVDAGSEKNLYKGLPVGEWTEITVNTDCKVNIPDAPEVESDTKFEDTTDCEARTVSTQEFERHTMEPVYNEETNTWTQGEWTEWAAVGEPVVRDATEEECPTPVVPPKVIPPTVGIDVLQRTGPSELLQIIAGFAAGGVLFGTGLMLIRRRLAL
jgi:hypothetical protein